ncbi:hypothetical protein GOBAR_AA15071 [Gossypium barbadense]|uniref:Uncharacterized protein n=1 Tax=Gossypium barbadense TaxID=3634 RepID=A0A2P5XQG4_GOSBA|nr:hypothetical protein GOBAR_AA15071 [Gossypium barbadense]
MMEMMTTIVKGKAKVGEKSGTLDKSNLFFYNDIEVYRKDFLLQVPGVTIQIPRVNVLPASEVLREVDKGKSIVDEEAHKFSQIEECDPSPKATTGEPVFDPVPIPYTELFSIPLEIREGVKTNEINTLDVKPITIVYGKKIPIEKESTLKAVQNDMLVIRVSDSFKYGDDL